MTRIIENAIFSLTLGLKLQNHLQKIPLSKGFPTTPRSHPNLIKILCFDLFWIFFD
jgi:hypothetical protein